jgi:competence protein ComEC
MPHLTGARLAERPARIRLSVRKGTAPVVGAFISLKARINPPASPFRPGGYDLARDLYFQRIGATGLALGTITAMAPPAAPSSPASAKHPASNKSFPPLPSRSSLSKL